MFDLARLAELHKPRDLAAVFQRGEYAEWHDFRGRVSARRVVIVVPHFLLREPYENVPFSLDPVVFTEHDHADAVARCLWANGAFALAVATARSYQRTGWFTQAKGMDSASPADPQIGLPQAWVETLRTDIPLSEARVAELHDLGFTALCSAEGSAMLGFEGFATCYGRKPDAALNWRKQPGTSLEALLSFGRLIHHLRRFAQEKFSAHLDVPTLLQLLDTWLKSIDFSESTLDGEIDLELRPPAAGQREFAIEVIAPWRAGQGRATLTAVVNVPLG
jgi:type VI secretion system protein ImpC